MKPGKLPRWESLAQKLNEFAAQEPPIEVFVLKCHLIIESLLYSFLALRLGMEERHLPTLQFFPLAKLALGGDEYSAALTKVLALNDLRNAFGHELEDSAFVAEYERFAERQQLYCPKELDARERDAIVRVRTRAVRAGCLIAVVNVWAPIMKHDLSTRTDRTADERERLIKSTDEARLGIEALRRKQAEFQAVIEQGRRNLGLNTSER